MISCRELITLLGDYVSDDLPPERRDHIDKHLGRCPSCLAYFESYTTVIKLTGQLPAAPLPQHLAQRLLAALAAEQRPAAGNA